MTKVFTYKWIAAIVLLISVSGKINAQTDFTIKYKILDSDSCCFAQKMGLQNNFTTRNRALDYVSTIKNQLQAKGYLAVSVDSVLWLENLATVFIYPGEKYVLQDLRIRPADMQHVRAAKINFQNVKKNGEIKYDVIIQQLLDYFENAGYPFAKINLDSIGINRDTISALLNIDKGFLYRVDSIKLFGSAKISTSYLHHYLGILKGSAFNKERMDKINVKLGQLSFVEQVQPWDISMLNTGGIINLYLKPRQNNQINFLAGFLPSNQQIGGKLLLTIDANLQLKNAFGSGEQVGFMWQQIQPRSPRINLMYAQPYIFNSPAGISFDFSLFKKDSVFLNIQGQAGISYSLSAQQSAKLLFQIQKTNVLQIDTLAIKLTKKLPDIADVRSVNIGAEYEINNTDYRFNPTRGGEYFFSFFSGKKTINKSNDIVNLNDNSFDYNRLYDTLNLHSYQVRIKSAASYYFKAGKRTVWKTAINAGMFFSDNYFRNELFQIGGNRILRGFDEESIFTNKYVVGTIEYRFLLNNNSNFYLFSDIGWTRNDIANVSNQFTGVGLGLRLQAKGGIFNISYALGAQDGGAISPRQSKIHLGYISVF